MSDFSSAWLALREPVDRAARGESLTDATARLLASKSAITVIDLGAGSGANLRYLAPRLAAAQSWILVDRDEALLREARAREGEAGGARIETLCCDLGDALSRLDLSAVDLVTASALMDLVSADWFDALAERCRRAAVPLLFALTYDGRVAFEPPDGDDELLRDLFGRHQRSDKGLGPALGPDAPAHMERSLRALGYQVRLAASDWSLGPDQAALQAAVLDGYAAAATEIAPDAAARIAAWHARRRALLEAGRSALRVGHRDLLAVL